MATTTQKKRTVRRAATDTRTKTSATVAAEPQPATEKVSEVAHEAIESLKEPVAEAERKIREFSARTKEQVKEKQETARSQTEHVIAEARSYAERKPLAAAGMAFAAGLLVSRLLRR